MRSFWILLACVLVSDAFFQPPTPLVTMYFPFPGSNGLLRTVRLVRRLMRMGSMFRRLHLTRRLVGMMPLLMLGRGGMRRGPRFLKAEDMCLKRLACEIFTKPDATHRGVVSSNTAREDISNGLKIFLTLDTLDEGDDYCKQRHPSCPFSALKILKGLLPLKIPPSDVLGATKHHFNLMI
ncbi:hypothetical protein CDAR_442521 [Caerostris darwini]|uniref:Uncharacterized protein n=1 Tax=Caerostris darwini TaxID=1538125 RepID=A0AAV4V091_9ARAC|nr:hypothetical protein CDAR_442521 [Caerostris darwini]